jgi:DNA-directed RNA polymerase omega subunit
MQYPPVKYDSAERQSGLDPTEVFYRMRKPTIDELLDQVDSIYELTMLAAKEARRIRLKDRDIKQPLQVALERIADGKVKGRFLNQKEMDEYESSERQKREAAAAMKEKSFSQVPIPPIEEP